MKPIIILLILILSYFYLSRKTPNYEVLFMIFILIVAGSNHILEGVKSKKDPPIPSLDDDDFAEKAYNYHKKVTCGSKGVKKVSEIFKQLRDATQEQSKALNEKYRLSAMLFPLIFNESICIDKTSRKKRLVIGWVKR